MPRKMCLLRNGEYQSRLELVLLCENWYCVCENLVLVFFCAVNCKQSLNLCGVLSFNRVLGCMLCRQLRLRKCQLC